MVGAGTGTIAEPSGRAALPRYERPREELLVDPAAACPGCEPCPDPEAAIATSALSPGARALLWGLLRVGTTRVFGGGGVGIEYGSLLKTAARPEYVAGHVREAAAHLRERQVDLLLVPGMSGYPIGSMYAMASGIPAVLLKKAKLHGDGQGVYPAGAFVIPSYTGEGAVVMHADQEAAQDVVDGIVAPQMVAQRHVERLVLTLRFAGADDIYDNATMYLASG